MVRCFFVTSLNLLPAASSLTWRVFNLRINRGMPMSSNSVSRIIRDRCILIAVATIWTNINPRADSSLRT